MFTKHLLMHGGGVAKLDPQLAINVDDITYMDNATIIVSIVQGATGYIDITIGNEYTGQEIITNGSSTFTVPNLNAGSKTVIATYEGNDNYTDSVVSTTFNVAKHESRFSGSSTNHKVGSNSVIKVSTYHPGMTGDVTIKLSNGMTFTDTLGRNGVKFVISDLSAGTYKVYVNYDGNENFLPVYNEPITSFKISYA